METDLFEFAYVPDWYGQLEELEGLVLPEPWKFKRPSVETKNQDTPILERYIHTIFRKQSIDFNSANDAAEAARYFHVENECACFHTGLYTGRYKAVYGFFDRNKRRDSMLDWYFRGFCDEISPRLKYIEPLPERPHYHAAWESTGFNPDWPVRVKVEHILGDEENMERIPYKVRRAKNLPLLLETAVELARRKSVIEPGIVVPQGYQGKVQYLLPIYLTNMKKPDLAMTLSVMDGYYLGHTCLTLEMAYLNTERATALIPLGAKIRETDDEGNETETDRRIDITSVNDGKNYIFDEEAVKEIGWIWKKEIWEDVNLPSNLLRKANQRLSELAKGITSMELTIVDESDTGADIPDIHARQYVECKSPPHGIDGRYLVLSKTKDYLNPSGNTITIGAGGVTLTSASVKQGQNISALEEDILGQESRISTAVKDASSALDATHSLKENIHECYSEISKTAEEINLSVREEYISRSELEAIQQDFETSITQNSTEIRFDFTQVTDEIKGTVAENQSLLEEYIRFKGALIELGRVGNAFTAELSGESLAFKENGQKIAYISNQSLVITNAEIRNKLSLGNESRGWFDFIPRANGNLSIKWRGPV